MRTRVLLYKPRVSILAPPWRWVAVAAILSVCGSTMGCDWFPWRTTAGPTQTVNVTTVIGASPSPTPSPSPSPGQITSVRVGFFGKTCPAGTATPAGPNELRFGCVGAATATPFVRSETGGERQATPAEHGTDIAWNVDVPGRCQLIQVTERFNQDVRANPTATGGSLGTCRVSATVKGIVGSFDVIVVP